jgi:molybdopterin-guanine dinucleotide biosynthesis protein A
MCAIDSPAAWLAAGERSLQSWLALVGRQAVPLPMEPLLSVNQPADLALFNRREFL